MGTNEHLSQGPTAGPVNAVDSAETLAAEGCDMPGQTADVPGDSELRAKINFLRRVELFREKCDKLLENLNSDSITREPFELNVAQVLVVRTLIFDQAKKMNVLTPPSEKLKKEWWTELQKKAAEKFPGETVVFPDIPVFEQEAARAGDLAKVFEWMNPALEILRGQAASLKNKARSGKFTQDDFSARLVNLRAGAARLVYKATDVGLPLDEEKIFGEGLIADLYKAIHPEEGTADMNDEHVEPDSGESNVRGSDEWFVDESDLSRKKVLSDFEGVSGLRSSFIDSLRTRISSFFDHPLGRAAVGVISVGALALAWQLAKQSPRDVRRDVAESVAETVYLDLETGDPDGDGDMDFRVRARGGQTAKIVAAVLKNAGRVDFDVALGANRRIVTCPDIDFDVAGFGERYPAFSVNCR